MTHEQLAEFLDQLHICALEEAPLWEIPPGSTDHVGRGRVDHGPWSAGDCAEVLARWLDRGWIGLQRLAPGPHHDLSAEEAREVLCYPATWAELRDLCLFVSDLGFAVGRDRWV